MASEREAGWQAFQRGDFSEAVSLLKAACRVDPTDYQAHSYLGAAYGKIGDPQAAIETLTAAVHLQPANAAARHNLGVALESGGHLAKAAEAYQQAVTLDPGYHAPQEALARLSHSENLRPGPGPDFTSHISTGAGSTPAQQSVSVPGMRHEESPSGSPMYASEIREPEPSPPEAVIPGFVSTSRGLGAALPSHGLLSDYSPSPHAPVGPSTVLETYTSELPPPNFNDEIDIPRALRDFGRIIISPDRYFREQVGRNGLMSPFLMVGIYLALSIITGLISSGAQGVIGFVGGLVVSPISLAVNGAWMIAMYLVLALTIHFLGWLFGNRQDFSVSFRAGVYADAPRFLLSLLASLYMAFVVMPGIMAHPITSQEIEQTLGIPPGSMTRGSNASAGATIPAPPTPSRRRTAKPVPQAKPAVPQPTPESVLRLARLAWQKFGAAMAVTIGFAVVGWAWSTVLLILAIHRLQQIPAWAAIGVVFLIYLLSLLLVALVIFGFAGLIIGLASGAMHLGGATGAGAGH